MKKKFIIISSLAVCILLYIVEQVIGVNYIVKTLVKILLFGLTPYLYIRIIDKRTMKKALDCKNIDRQRLKMGFVFGIVSFFIVLLAYYLLKDTINLQSIAAELDNKSNITPANFIFIGLYITLGNSFLEEFFFRGFIFLNLYKLGQKKFAYIYSSLIFGLYHIAIFKTWFNLWITVLALLGLISIGFIFNWLDTKSGNFINSWIVHILADSAIILIGLKMFGII